MTDLYTSLQGELSQGLNGKIAVAVVAGLLGVAFGTAMASLEAGFGAGEILRLLAMAATPLVLSIGAVYLTVRYLLPRLLAWYVTATAPGGESA